MSEKEKLEGTKAIGRVTSHSNASIHPMLPSFLRSRCVFFELGCPSAVHIHQAIVVFMAGEHRDAILRMGDLIATVCFNSIFYIVRARAQ